MNPKGPKRVIFLRPFFEKKAGFRLPLAKTFEVFDLKKSAVFKNFLRSSLGSAKKGFYTKTPVLAFGRAESNFNPDESLELPFAGVLEPGLKSHSRGGTLGPSLSDEA